MGHRLAPGVLADGAFRGGAGLERVAGRKIGGAKSSLDTLTGRAAYPITFKMVQDHELLIYGFFIRSLPLRRKNLKYAN